MIRAIIFDCFGVLYLNSSQHFYETKLSNYDKLRNELLSLSAQADYGYISSHQLHVAVSELTGLPLELIDDELEGIHKCNQQLLDYSQRLRSRYKVGMLSNISVEGMKDYFSDPARERLFDASLLSGEVGMTKPHPHIFEMIADKLGVTPGECVMIDDIEDNCAGADAAGMKAIQYRSNGQLRQELETLLARDQVS